MALCALCLTATSQNVPDYVPTDGLVAWYPFNGNANDESGNGNDAIVIGADDYEDRFGNGTSALNFASVDDWVDTPTLITGSEYTLQVWALFPLPITEDGHNTFISDWNLGAEADLMFMSFHEICGLAIGDQYASGNCIQGIYGTNLLSSEIDDGWHLITLTSFNGLTEFFVDGNPYTTLNHAVIGTIECFGNNAADQGVAPQNAGVLDDIGFWDRSLTDEEVLGLYLAEVSTAGCIDSLACNFDEEAEEDDGSCVYTTYGQNCDGDCAGSTLWFVDVLADPLEEIGDSMAPFSTIQAAFDAACPSDTILVAPGTYIENVSLTAEDITVRGYAPSLDLDSIASQVIIDGAELGTAFYVSGAKTVLMDLTIQNGKSGYGAGLYMEGCNGSLVQRCIIRDNVGTGDITAHGIQLGASDCIIEDCLITGNYGRKHTVNAGGINNVIRNCRITDNNAWETGGGIVVYTTNMLIENCLIANNNNGGVTTYKDDTVIDHCTITENTNFGCFIWCYSNNADFYITNSIIANNGSSEFKMLQTGDKVATAHLRNVLVEGGVDYDWISVYKQFDADSSLIALPPDLQINFELASTSPAIAAASNLRFGFDGLLSVASSVQDLEFGIRPAPSGTSADLGCFEHPLGVPEPTLGCMDIAACNFNVAATDEDGSCIMPTCDDPTACNFDENGVCGGGLCIPSGCMESEACNFNSLAECEGESCDYSCCPGPGCCLEGTTWDYDFGGCISNTTCQEDLDGDGVIGVNDLMQLLSVFGTDCEAEDVDPELGEFTCGDLMNYHGYDYATVQIGEQCWFAENLRTAQYSNGDEVLHHPQGSSWLDAANAESGAWAHFSNDSASGVTYGKLYNWYVTVDERGICPSGWHVPENAEWSTLVNHYGGSASAAIELKGNHSGVWFGNGTDGFNALPGGFRDWGNAVFFSQGTSGDWWTSSHQGAGFWRGMDADLDNVHNALYGRAMGNSVRCLKNTE